MTFNMNTSVSAGTLGEYPAMFLTMQPKKIGFDKIK